jgi:hypothetical protein
MMRNIVAAFCFSGADVQKATRLLEHRARHPFEHGQARVQAGIFECVSGSWLKLQMRHLRKQAFSLIIDNQ